MTSKPGIDLDLDALNLLTQKIWNTSGVGPKILLPGTHAEADVKGAGIFDIIPRGIVASTGKQMFEVWAPQQALMNLGTSQAIGKALVRAVGQVVRDQGLPIETVYYWLGTDGFRNAVVAYIKDEENKAAVAAFVKDL